MSKDVEKWIDETASILVQENLKLLKDCPKPEVDYDIGKALSYIFLKKYVKALLDHALTAHAKQNLDNEQAYEYTKTLVNELKVNLQNMICGAFEDSFASNTNQFVDYYCVIAPVGKAINREPC